MASSERKPRVSKVPTAPLKKVLIANRGEIACRIIRSCRALGIATVAVYSEADRHAQHVTLADEALPLGGSEAKESYLSIPKLLTAIKQSAADAVHPGYGFLSENAALVEQLERADICFIGPPATAMRALGDKLAAKAIAHKVKAPTAPTLTLNSATDRKGLGAFTREHGFPLLVKAAGGGGGRGMRVVHQAEDLEAALAQASREAESFFSDGRVFIEKLVVNARHIEVQVLGDRHGTILAVGDRDCTAQRRHQKFLEEAPAPAIDAKTRARMHHTAIALCESAGYESAGTVEFLLDRSGDFFFLEVNSRLQVEHPVTEAVTGLDLVALQLRIAQGERLAELLPEGAPAPRGHAIELRLCAEVPELDFAASTGRLRTLSFPRTESVRIDAGFRTGDVITHYYDSLLAKVIAHAADRDSARQLAYDALWHTEMQGVRSNAAFLLGVLDSPEFQAMEHHTKSIDNRPATDRLTLARRRLLAAGLFLISTSCSPRNPPLSGWRLYGNAAVQRRVRVDGEELQLTLSISDGGAIQLSDGNDGMRLELSDLRIDGLFYAFFQDGVQQRARIDPILGIVQLSGAALLTEEVIRSTAGNRGESKEINVTATLPGKIITVKVTANQQVAAGDVLLILESMKMEHPVRAVEAARVVKLSVQAGDIVEARSILMVLAPESGRLTASSEK